MTIECWGGGGGGFDGNNNGGGHGGGGDSNASSGVCVGRWEEVIGTYRVIDDPNVSLSILQQIVLSLFEKRIEIKDSALLIMNGSIEVFE